MLKIKGIDVLLHSGDATEMVGNVLVGEPSVVTLPFSAGGIPAYTLAIPKGDAHIWTDAVVELFGSKFRTIGTPEQGIEENIPTQWHKKVRVQLIVTNGTCTIYEKNTFRRHVFRDVFFCDLRGESASKAGATRAGELQVYVYSCIASDGYVPKIGDIIVLDECMIEFDTTSERTVSESMANLRNAYPSYAAVKTVNPKLCGTRFDYEITA